MCAYHHSFTNSNGTFVTFDEDYMCFVPPYSNILLRIVLFSSVNFVIFLYWLHTIKSQKPAKPNIPVVSRFPINIPVLGGLYTPFKFRNEGLKFLEDLVNLHGPIFELPFGQIKVVVVADATVIKKLLTSKNPNHLNKPRYIYDKVFENILNQGLLVADHDVWSFHRSVTNRAFNYKSLQQNIKIINKQANILIQKMLNASIVNQGVVEMSQVHKFLDFHTLGIIAETLWGPKCYSDDTNKNIQRAIHRAKEITLYRFLHPELFVDFLWKLHPKKWELDRLWTKLIQELKENIDGYKIEYQKSNHLPVCNDPYSGNYLKYNDYGEKPSRCMIEEMLHCGMSDNEIFSEIATIIIAGFETTLTSLNTTLFHFALNPKVQEKCWEEVDCLMRRKQAIGSTGFSMDDLVNLKYLERCILENVRLTSTVPIFSRRLDSPLQVSNELEFQEGQVILMLPWVLHRDPRHFPNPMQFDPDRFLAENVMSRDAFAFVPFSSGPRNCVGRKFAMLEMKLILALIIWNFEIHSEDTLADIKFLMEASLRPHREFKMTFTRRTMT